jgi:hypothetical protein
MTQEEIRLADSRDRKAHWKRWGTYLALRAWGTVREDYSADGEAWTYFPFEHARSRVYRWNEDGLLGFCDRHQMICFGLALWNERDPILKERPFGLSGKQGNHGEDVKEYYFFLDATPTHSYCKALYKYPQKQFPYQQIIEENARRTRDDLEYELLDTGIFDDNRYFDVFVEYAKADVEDLLIRISVVNRGPDVANLRVLPSLWFRNTWSWGEQNPKPQMRVSKSGKTPAIVAHHAMYGQRWLSCEGSPELLFTDNETNDQRLFNAHNSSPFVKDGIGDYIVSGDRNAVNPAQTGTKAAAHYRMAVPPAQTETIRLRFSDVDPATRDPFADFDQDVSARIAEADEFYAKICPDTLSPDARNVMRQGFAGMLWNKQFYHFVVRDWLNGDPGNPPPPPERWKGRDHNWTHLYNGDVISMPDTWEYPWYAAWDLAFHCVALSLVDSEFAKEQLILLLREWYMHPNGQIPAYEWNFGDVNPPVHAWAALRVYKIEEKRQGKADAKFLERVFLKLLLNFTWWVNRKDTEGMNIFQGGFLGLDNIGLFDRSKPLPNGGYLEQSDGTSWMAMYTLSMGAIALELAKTDPAYEDVASKFWEHFVYIAHAMNHRGHDTLSLWDEDDGFFYDVLRMPDGSHSPLRIRSMVGLIPLIAVGTLEPEVMQQFPDFTRRMDWFIKNRPDLLANMASITDPGSDGRRLLSIVNPDQLRRVLSVMLDEQEFLSPCGIRSLSRYHRDHPFSLEVDGMKYEVDYEPAESKTGLFGGNSNWRGPVWFPVNFLLIEALQRFHYYLGDDYRVEFPTGSGNQMTLWDVAAALSRRLTRLFLKGENGRRPVYGATEKFQTDPDWRDHILFFEYFHGDVGCGLGASHQTGWTGLVTKLMQQSGEFHKHPRGGKG